MRLERHLSGLARPLRARLCGAALVLLYAAAPALGDTLLDAAQRRDAANVRTLLAEGADPNERSVDGSTPLLYAAHFGDAESAAALLASGADPKLANRYGMAPIHEAALRADAPMLEQLLDAGADLEHALPEGETPLMLASRTGGVAAVELLIARGANVNVVEQWQGYTPLMYAAVHDRPAVAAALIAAGADVRAKTRRADLPKRIAAARFNVEFPLGEMMPLHFAAREGATAAARVLVEAGAPLDEPTPEGFTPLVLAVHNLHYDTAKLLLDAGASAAGGALYAIVNARNRVQLDGPKREPTGTTTELDLLRAALATGVDVGDRPPQPLPDRDIGFGSQPVAVVDTALIRAARSADLESMRLLIAAGADPKAREPGGLTTALAVAAGPEIPLLTVVDRERPAEPDAIAALRFLAEHGVDLNAGDRQGATPLHTLAKRGFTQVIAFLIGEAGADVNARDAQGRTPLDYALGRSPVLFGKPPESAAAAALLREHGGVEGARR